MPGDLFNFRAKRLDNPRLDGDTIDAEIDLGFHIFARQRLRLICADGSGINAPERREDGGQAAFDYLQELMPVGESCIIRTYRGPGDKYGRWLAVVLLADGSSLGDEMIAAGHAVAKEY